MTRISESYDGIADTYAQQLFGELENKPIDRELLTRFAVDTWGRGRVCDLGCGPGQIARFLRDLDAQAFGIDLSEGMIAQARRLSPDIEFQLGDMTALPLEDAALAGVVSFYSIVNIPEDWLPKVFSEMERVLIPGGLLLLAFHAGSEVKKLAELLGRPVDLDLFYRAATDVADKLKTAGFLIEEIVERDPYAPEVEHQSRRAYIFARKLPIVADRPDS
jgi:SAM-dependent methyltransferase